MRKTMIAVIAATMLVGAGGVAPARAGVDVHVNIGPPGALFDAEPEVVVVPRTRVYYAPAREDYDVYRYGDWWYANRDGNWFRARTYSGPFAPVVYERVPRQILVVPPKYHRHGFRPVRRSERRHDRGWDHREHDSDHGRGHHDRGHGHHDRD